MSVISVIGNIASGKSTLLSALRQEGFATALEPVNEWKFLPKFYEDPNRWAFALQVEVLNSFITSNGCKGRLSFTERSAWESYVIFCKNAYNNGYLIEEEYNVLGEIATYANDKPDVFVYLKSTPTTCYRRMMCRARPCEEKVTLDYLTKLHEIYERTIQDLVKSDDRKIITLDGDLSENEIIGELLKNVSLHNLIHQQTNPFDRAFC